MVKKQIKKLQYTVKIYMDHVWELYRTYSDMASQIDTA